MLESASSILSPLPTIRTAVLLAAGRGKRLGSLTASVPKPLLEIAGQPLLAHIVDALAQTGIIRIVVVTGYLGEQIDEFCARRSYPNLRLESVRQSELNGTGGAMIAARPRVGGESCFVFGWGDILMDPENYIRFVERACSESYDFLLAINRTGDPWRGAAVYLDAAMRVSRIIEKPPPGSSTTNWNNAGLFAATPLLFEYLDRLMPSPRGELELPDAIAAMIVDGRNVRAVDVRGFWSDIGTPEELALARARFKPERSS